MINTTRLENTFIELISIDGETGNEAKVADYIQRYLDNIGISSVRDEAGETFGGNCGNVIAFLESNDNKNNNTILLSCHMDTIESTKGIKVISENGRIKTDGSTILGADNRAGVSVILEALHTVREKDLPYSNIQIVFSVAEERGMYGTKYINENDLKAVAGFVFDSSAKPGSIITNAPASVVINIKVHGKAAHAAVNPTAGINAIKIAGNAIANIEVGKFKDGTLFNFGKINGGKATNIVPDYVEITAECRGFDINKINERVQMIENCFMDEAALLDGRIEFEVIEKYGLLNVDENSLSVQICEKAINALGLKAEKIVYTGGSDANVYMAKGIDTVNLGMGFQNVHSTMEYIELADLIIDSEIALEIIQQAYKFSQEKISSISNAK